MARPCKNWKQFERGKCDDAVEEPMGIDAIPPEFSFERSLLFLRTSSETPYCLGEMGSMAVRKP